MSNKERFGSKLLVEGNDDKHVILALCKQFQVPENFDIIDCEGIDNLFKQIDIRFKQFGVNTIGIIIDADVDVHSRWEKIKGILEKLHFTVPDTLPSSGLITKNSDNKIVGVWIMPNNNINGMIEDFMTFLVPPEDKLLPIVNATLLTIEEQNLHKYSLLHKSKATIHCWLSLQEDPGTPMGLSISKRYVTTDTETCKQLIHWITTLYTYK